MTNLSLRTNGDFRAIGKRPLRGNVDGSLNIGVTNKTAGTTGKTMLLTNTDRTTSRASLRRVPGVNEDHQDAGLSRFVCDVLPELIEGPATHAATVMLAMLQGSRCDALQILQTDEAIVSLGKPDNALADVVVRVALIPAFPASQPFQDALCAFRASPLKGYLDAGEFLPLSVDLAPRENKASGSCSDARSTPSGLEPPANNIGNFDADVCEELIGAPVITDRASAILKTLQQFALVVTQSELNADSTGHSRNGGFCLRFNIAKKAFVDRQAGGSEYFSFYGSDTIKNPYNVIRLESVNLLHVVVVEGRKSKPVIHSLPVAVDGDFIAGSRKLDHRFRQCQSLIVTHYQLAFDGLNHTYILTEEHA